MRIADYVNQQHIRSNFLCNLRKIFPISLNAISPNFLQLTTGYAEDDNVTRLINTYDFYILPVMNPDGYEYQWNTVSSPAFMPNVK